MARVEFRLSLRVDRRSIFFEMLIEDRRVGYCDLDSAEAEQLIEMLMDKRLELADEVAREIDPGTRLPVLVDPVWRAPGFRLDKGRILALRHPGLGWLSFCFPDKEAEKIAETLRTDFPVAG